MTAMHIPRRLVQQLLARAQASPDAEICGLICGKNGQMQRLLPIANVADNPANEFDMDEAGLVEAMRKIRDNDDDLVAIYHSHPTEPPVPSAADLATLPYPEALYLIVSLNIKGVLEMQAWQRGSGEPTRVPLHI